MDIVFSGSAHGLMHIIVLWLFIILFMLILKSLNSWGITNINKIICIAFDGVCAIFLQNFR